MAEPRVTGLTPSAKNRRAYGSLGELLDSLGIEPPFGRASVRNYGERRSRVTRHCRQTIADWRRCAAQARRKGDTATAEALEFDAIKLESTLQRANTAAEEPPAHVRRGPAAKAITLRRAR